jgi:pantoate--beta-alanine ligase
MQIARRLSDLRAACTGLKAARGTLSLVPTMGALHAGHIALIAAARASGGAVGASIFVNPTQFAENEDLTRYPRQEAADLAALEQAGCDLVWLPDVATMYPPDDASLIEVAGPARLWEGTQRPGHFRGVATVVAKLFGQTRAERAFFGEKDWQQFQVVRRMVADLHLPIDIIGVPTVREADGLAMSSRNRFLTAAQRQLAPMLYTSLCAAASARSCTTAISGLSAAGFVIDYFDFVDAVSLEKQTASGSPLRLIAAARLGDVRLLDNIGVDAL